MVWVNWAFSLAAAPRKDLARFAHLSTIEHVEGVGLAELSVLLFVINSLGGARQANLGRCSVLPFSTNGLSGCVG